MEQVLLFVVAFTVLKSILVGSDFNFYYCLKYGSKYTKWYFNRQAFCEYMKENNEHP